MAANSVLGAIETEASTLWHKFSAWFGGEVKQVEVVISADEQKILAVVKPLFAAAESAVLADLATTIKAILVSIVGAGTMDLPTLEGIVLDKLELVEPQLLAVAQGLGSKVLQAVINLILAQL